MNVGVICPVFNARADLLRAAAGSVLAQGAHHSCEVLLIDDGSTAADTIASLGELQAEDARVRLVRTEKNQGPARARNRGLAATTHDWIAFIDADDLWPPGKLDRVEAVHRERPDTLWIGGQFTTLGADGSLAPSLLIPRKCPSAEVTSGSARLRTPELTRVLVGDWQHLGTSVIHRSLIAAVGGFDEQLLYGEDWLWFLRMSLLAPLDYISHETYILRRHGASMMHSAGRMSAHYARSSDVARRLPELRPFRKELRWFSYRIYKEIAMNNLLHRRRKAAWYFAVRAFLVSRNEVLEFLFFCFLLCTPGRQRLRRWSARYSAGDQLDLTTSAATRDGKAEAAG